MRLKPGCSCLVLILAALNAFVAISALVGLVQGKTSAAVSLLSLAIFGSNVALCTMVGVQSIRSRNTSADAQGIGGTGGDEGEDTGDAAANEGEDQP